MRKGKTHRQSVLVVLLALSVSRCPDSGAGNANRGEPQIVEQVSLQIERTAPARLDSLDGLVTLEIPPLSVSQTTLITLAKVYVPDAEQERGISYLLGPEGLVFERAIRMTFRAGALPAAIPLTELRAARFYQAEAGAWLALDRPELTSSEILGRTTETGLFEVLHTAAHSVEDVQDFSSTSEADVLFSRGKIANARAAYTAVLALPEERNNVRARLGRALCSMLLLPDSTAVRNVLARCGLDPMTPDLLYGSGGYLDVVAADLAGTADLTLDFGVVPSISLAESVSSRVEENKIVIKLKDRDHIDGPWTLEIQIELDSSDYAFGNDLQARNFPGTITLTGPSGSYLLQPGSSGLIHIDAAGRAHGQEVAATFHGVTLVTSPTSLVRINGTVVDVLAETPRPEHRLFTAAPQVGPPYRTAAAKMLSECSAGLTSEFIFTQVQLFESDLREISEDLSSVLSQLVSGDTGVTQPALSSFLLNTPDDIHLNLRDIKLLIAGVDGFSTLVDLAAPYLFFGYDALDESVALNSFLQEQQLSYTTPANAIEQRSEVNWSAEACVEDLNRNLLRAVGDPQDLPTALDPARQALGNFLQQFIDALLQEPDRPGIIELSSVETGNFTLALAATLQALQASLNSSVPVSASSDPGYSFTAKAFFESPPSRATLLAAIAGDSLFAVDPGSVDATTAEGRNPSVVFADGLLSALLGTFMVLPQVPNLDCQDSDDCTADGIYCDFATGVCQTSGDPCTTQEGCVQPDVCLGQCQRVPFEGVPEVELQRALGGDEPEVVDPHVWQIIAPLLKSFPRF